MTTRESLEIAAEPGALFNLTQDYDHRLDWDPFLKEARLVGADRPGVGAKAWCVARSGLGMETRYVSYRPPEVCAVEMTRGPRCLRSFAGSWRFEPIGSGRTRVDFTYSLEARPRFLTGILSRIFARESRRRLLALKRAAEA